MASYFKFQNEFFESLNECSTSLKANIQSNYSDYLELSRINYEAFKKLNNKNMNIETEDLKRLVDRSQKFINGIK